MEWKVRDLVVAEIVAVDRRNKYYPVSIRNDADGGECRISHGAATFLRPLPAPLTPLERAVVEKAKVWRTTYNSPLDALSSLTRELAVATDALIAADKPPSEPSAAWVPKVGEWVRYHDRDSVFFVTIRDIKPPNVRVSDDNDMYYWVPLERLSNSVPIPAPDLSALRDAVVENGIAWRATLGVQNGVADSWTSSSKNLVLAIDALRAAMAPPAPPDPVEELREAALAWISLEDKFEAGENTQWGEARRARDRVRAALAALDKKDGAP